LRKLDTWEEKLGAWNFTLVWLEHTVGNADTMISCPYGKIRWLE